MDPEIRLARQAAHSQARVVTPFVDDPDFTLYVGDALDVLPTLDLTDAVVITDPPYNVGIELDGAKVRTALASALGVTDLTKFKVAGCVQLNMGGWAGTVDPKLSSVTMAVDYVRAYELP